MKRYVTKPTTQISQPTVDITDDIAVSFDLEDLLDKGGEILRREIANLLMESSRGKLNSASARDLVSYIQLLSKLKSEKQDELENMSDDKLKELLK